MKTLRAIAIGVATAVLFLGSVATVVCVVDSCANPQVTP